MIDSRAVPGALLRVLMVVAGLLAAQPVSAGRQVTVPVRLDAAYLQEVFASQMFTEPGTSARVWDDGSGCNFLEVSNPRIATSNGLLDVVVDGRALVGQAVGDRCIVVLDWSGTIEMYQKVEVEPGGTSLSFHTVDSRVDNESVRHGIRLGVLWKWIKRYVQPRLDDVRVNLRPELDDLKDVLQLVLPERDESLDATLASLHLQSAEIVDDGLQVGLAMQVPAQDYVEKPPAPTLTPAELARFQSTWRGWDGFVTFVVKHVAGAAQDREIRRDLLDVLIEARYDVLDILSSEAPATKPDPVRGLFIKTWTRLAPILGRLSPKLKGEHGLRLLSFIAAADALKALDTLGPQFNLDISLDGLRRMARILAPGTEEDPLRYGQEVDPGLRELLNFGPPLPLRRDPDPQAAPEPQGWWHGLVHSAHAAVSVDEKLVNKLNSWIPPPDEIDSYLKSVHRLLDETGRGLAADSDLDPSLHDMFRRLVLATAWQETCWRQFTRVDGKIVPIQSPAGAVGMMQVVPSVWRGFYDTGGLTRDIGYNAAAGAEILMHYLVDYVIPHDEGRKPAGRDDLAWATYAAYNGGPGQLRRYLASSIPGPLRRIDAAFRAKFRKIQDGDELAVRSCYSG